MSQPPGLGQPGPNQPDFLPSGAEPSSSGWPPPQLDPGHRLPTGVYQPAATPAPSIAPSVAYPPPVPPTAAPDSPRKSSRGWVTLVAGLVVLGLIAAVVFSQFQASPPPAPVPSPTPVTLSPTPSIVRTPFAPSASASEPVTGGMIGEPVRFTGVSGTGTVTVVSAVWGTGGTLAPEEGNWYLTLELRFEGVSGQVVTGLLFTTVRDAQGESHPFTIGPTLTNGLPTRLLSKGQVSTGTVAFELPRGPVTVVILSEALEPVAEISLP